MLIRTAGISTSPYFRILAFSSLHAVGSASLLGIGGWLITQNELTVGQLVAAELVLSAIFIGLSRFGQYLEMYYDICASMVKLSEFFALKTEASTDRGKELNIEPSLRFDDVEINYRNQSMKLNLDFPADSLSFVSSNNSQLTKAFTDLVQGFQKAEAGQIWFGDSEIRDLGLQQLRDRIAVIDDFLFPEVCIEEFLRIAKADATHAEITHVLSVVLLKDIIDDFPEQLQTLLTPTGYPLSKEEILRLKLAFALLSNAQIIILTPAFDILKLVRRKFIMEHLKQEQGQTVIYWSNRRDMNDFDQYLFVENQSTHQCSDIENVKSMDKVSN